MTLIEFHILGDRVAIDAEQITCVHENGDEGSTMIYLQTEDSPWPVDEDYDEVLRMVQEATAAPELQDYMVPGFLPDCGGGVS